MESRLTNLEIENLEFRLRLQLAEQNITVIDECLEISKQGKLLQCEALMREGCTQKQIAEIMNLHINTIKGYYKEIKGKVQ
jgi:DNA-binding NarL/FixJ family response regulator